MYQNWKGGCGQVNNVEKGGRRQITKVRMGGRVKDQCAKIEKGAESKSWDLVDEVKLRKWRAGSNT